MRLISSNELAFSTLGDAVTVAGIILHEGYVVMLSREEDLYILNYEFSYNEADRNDVVFMDREEFDRMFYEREEECKQEIYSGVSNDIPQNVLMID